ncbi:hypothetical protein L3i22_055530 [Actinoplanes sp. L3-i22]|nr:hypothetical protein L3i22_055530 [Actinoplanes sp. L3-i22]
MRQRSFSVLVATATGLAVAGLFATPASAMPAHRSAPRTTAESADFSNAETTGFAAGQTDPTVRTAAITSWDPQLTATAAALGTVTPTPVRDDHSRHPMVWSGSTVTVADARTVNRSEATEEAAPSRRPASQYV